MVIGTPNYMSPEQVRGDAIDHRSDIFAVGLVLYELLVYRQAFEAETQPAVLMKILSDQPAPLAMLDPLVDAGVAQVVYKALAKNPADRYQDLGAMKAELVRIVQRLETEASDGRTMMVAPPPPRGMQVVPTQRRPRRPAPPIASSRHFAAIDAALAAGDDARARQELQLATQAAPGHPRLGEMGAKISQARTERELARSIGEARARLAAGALTEAGQWLARAQKVAPHAPEVAELRQELERAADGREQDRDRQRRVAAALAHAREALRGGAFDTAMRAATEALGLDPNDAEAQAVRAEIEAARAGAGAGPGAGAASRVVGPPPPASARQSRMRGRPAGRSRARARPSRHRPLRRRVPLPCRRSSRCSRRRWAARPDRLRLARVCRRSDRRSCRSPSWASPSSPRSCSASARSSSGTRSRRRFLRPPQSAQEAPATPGTPGTTEPASTEPPASASTTTPPATPPAEPRPTAPASTEPPAVPPTTPASEDAAITARLAHAVTEFQAQRTAPALNTLASLIDEAPQRDDLRQTAEQWARAIQSRDERAARQRAQAGPIAARDADGRRLRPARRNGARRRRSDRRGTRLRTRPRSLGGDRRPPGVTRADRGAERRRPRAGARPARTDPHGQPAAPREPATREPAAREPEPTTRELPAQGMTPEQEFERANIMRLLQSFKRAFDSRSGDSLRPIWPTLSAGAAQSYQGAVAARAVAAVDLQQRAHPHGCGRQARQRRLRGHGHLAAAGRP